MGGAEEHSAPPEWSAQKFRARAILSSYLSLGGATWTTWVVEWSIGVEQARFAVNSSNYFCNYFDNPLH